jgi:hypothetical protein
MTKYRSFLTQTGKRLGRLPVAAHFASINDNQWIALGGGRIARVSTDGRGIWAHKFVSFGQPVVDALDSIYVCSQHQVAAFDGNGNPRFNTQLDASPSCIAVIAPGVGCALLPGRLVFIE